MALRLLIANISTVFESGVHRRHANIGASRGHSTSSHCPVSTRINFQIHSHIRSISKSQVRYQSTEGEETHSAPRGIKRLNKILATRIVPDIPAEDLEEQFVRGSGPGGQCINKTSSSVSLTHKPTGIRIQCQETRSLQQNRRIARRILRDKIDQLENPGLAKHDIRAEKERRRKQNRAKKSKRKMRDAAVGVEDGGDADDSKGSAEQEK